MTKYVTELERNATIAQGPNSLIFLSNFSKIKILLPSLQNITSSVLRQKLVPEATFWLHIMCYCIVLRPTITLFAIDLK